jgi:putative DNA methylase
MTQQPKKLIEVAMPIKEISAESVRDKSIRHGHISTLHLWWARRPLPVCRAVVFASLVPDPLDKNCPLAFKDAVELLLGKANNPGDPYKTYSDIPWTAIFDPMEDNLRNRLQMFIGKFTEDMQQHLLHNKPKPAAGKMLSDFSMIKWDNKNNEKIINKARQLIWVAHNAASGKSATELIADFNSHYSAIKKTEQELYSIPDRHIAIDKVNEREAMLHQAIEAFLDKMPKVFDPFAGGGAIPLEAARLGCRSFGNDINPVAHIIQKGSLEFPQKYGKPITYTKDEFIKIYGQEAWNNHTNDNLVFQNGEAIAVNIANRLSYDVEYYILHLLKLTSLDIGHLYPTDSYGKKPIIYYWARIGICTNPTCKAEVPLLRSLYLCNKSDKIVYLNPIINGKNVDFTISYGKTEKEGFCKRGNIICPVCQNATDVKFIKQQSLDNNLNSRLIAVIEESSETKKYRLPYQNEIDIISQVPEDVEVPQEAMQRNSGGGDTFGWGITKWGQLYTKRQLFAMHSFVKNLLKLEEITNAANDDYGKAISTYIALFVDRMATRLTAFGLWNTKAETLEHAFARQAIPMVLDFPETNPFSRSTGGAYNQLDWIIRYIETESSNSFYSICNNTSSGDTNQFENKSINAVVTDPPYYDAIAYADISDYFYVWLKRTLGNLYPYNFATPQTPKSEECTALKHHHGGDLEKAKRHFETKLSHIFSTIENQTNGLVSIMFAHQSTEAWTTICNSILGARMNITGSWAIDTERTSGVKVDKAFLASSVTVSCLPIIRQGIGSFKEVKIAIEKTVSKEVDELYLLGFRGADLLTACFGQAVSEFGKYEKVEKADGTEVTVAELLELARESAFNALLKGFDGDDYTKFYIGWLQLYGFVESEHSTAMRITQVGLSINIQDLYKDHILLSVKSKATLATFSERIHLDKHLGEKPGSFLIDQVHRAMALYKGTNRNALLQYISKMASSTESSFWRVVTSLCEVLPSGCDDHQQATGLHANKDSLIRESKNTIKEPSEQGKFDF